MAWTAATTRTTNTRLVISSGQGRVAALGALSFRITLRSQPSYTAASVKPLVDILLALETMDVFGFGTFATGYNLPVIFGYPLYLEDHAGLFAHGLQICPEGSPVSRDIMAATFKLTVT